ncbi:hypothetical protein JL721_10774 [Aureococcus anophagefferens]|nr:hypothetical protein JL721_10774 [Aureococcus anophagefferens]
MSSSATPMPPGGFANVEDEPPPSRKRGRSPEPAAPRAHLPRVTPKYVCNVCGNRDQRKFLHEPRAGDVVCLGADETGCGNVVEEHKMHEGAQYRKFEGEDDKSHHGPAPNRLYSAAHNMRTSMVPTGGAGGAAASRLRQAYDAALFANFRDEKEYVQRYDAVLAACVVQAAEEAAEDEHRKSLLAPAAKAEAPRPLVASSRARLLAKPLGSVATLGDGAMAPPVAVARRRHPAAPTKGAPRPAPTNTVRAGKDWAAALEDLGSDDSDDD